jgi:serine/threonine protein kinase
MSVNDYEQFEAFLRAMLQYEPSDRKTPKELLKEPWLSKGVLGLSASKSAT